MFLAPLTGFGSFPRRCLWDVLDQLGGEQTCAALRSQRRQIRRRGGDAQRHHLPARGFEIISAGSTIAASG